MSKIPNIHPGKILEKEFIKPFHISAYRLAKATNIPATRISEIINGRRRITADTALRFSKFFGTTPDFWMGLQTEYDLREEKTNKIKELDSIIPIEQLNVC